jgi:hypothetical protein
MPAVVTSWLVLLLTQVPATPAPSPGGTLRSPSGLVVDRLFDQGSHEYHFCEDGRVKLDTYSGERVLHGVWWLSGDTVHLLFTRETGLEASSRPAGEPVRYDKPLAREESLEWARVSRQLERGGDSEYSLGTPYPCEKPQATDVLGDHPQTSLKALTLEDLQGLSREQLRWMRNEVFARHGYRFKDAKLRSAFSKKPWYKPRLDSQEEVMRRFSELERRNVELIQQQEAVRP